LGGTLGESDVSGKIDESGESFKANLSYEFDEDILLYAQWVEGFRLGNVTALLPPSLCDVNNDGILDGTNTSNTDPFFESDSVKNIELGIKWTLLDNRLQINAAAYQVDWDEIPLTVVAGKLPEQAEQICNGGVVSNAGEARSQGLELETTFQLNDSFLINFGGAYTEAELTGVNVGIPFFEGDRLPSSPEYSVNLGLQYEFELSGYAAYARGDYAYVSSFFNLPGELGDEGGDYGQLDLSLGVTVDKFNIDINVQNATNEDALTSVGVVHPDTRAYRLRPRTIGLSIGYHF